MNTAPIRHGTISGYTSWNCRCDECKEAWKLYMRRYRARLKAKASMGDKFVGKFGGGGAPFGKPQMVTVHAGERFITLEQLRRERKARDDP